MTHMPEPPANSRASGVDARPRSRPEGFTDVADEYERGRPPYPPGAVDVLRRELGLQAGTDVLDLAAGTGKFTRALTATGARVVAVEPLPRLRARLDADENLDGKAEAIPLPDAAVELATVGDAWHWFAGPRAADELARVVRPGGGVALLWQTPVADEAPEWAHALGPILLPLRGDHPAFRDEQGRPALDTHPAFDGLRLHAVPFLWEPAPDEYLAFIGSISFVGALPEAERRRVRDQVRAVLPDGPLRIPYETRVWVTRRRPA